MKKNVYVVFEKVAGYHDAFCGVFDNKEKAEKIMKKLKKEYKKKYSFCPDYNIEEIQVNKQY